ncbi:MAG: hypothetical protein GYA41_12670 [Bacteroidales bacterium]|nr:hypothetical protein [Bacteroidales bacterium]
MKRLFAYTLMLLTGTITPFSLNGAKIRAQKTGQRINVTIDDRFFTSYIFSEDEKYPFFYPVNGPLSGSSVTSMRNAIYPHHSSLFFGCDMVNGGNYWQEGLERGRIISVNAVIEKEGGDTAVITDECIWARPGAASPIRDIRRYVITSPYGKMTRIDVQIELQMLADVRIMKTNHSLFSARMAADLSVTSGGTMINAEGLKSEKETFGKASAWIDYYGPRGSCVEGLAIMQHPSNKWYPSPWFTRDYGFMSPTQMYWPPNGEYITLPKGMVLTFRYRVLVHAGTCQEAKIAEEFEKFKTQ